MPLTRIGENPTTSLIGIFVVWKLLLFIVAIASPGKGYDTSTNLLSLTEPGIVSKFVRWDAIYFTKVVQRDYVFEQEWAFGWGYTRLLRLGVQYLGVNDTDTFPTVAARTGIAVSHISHLISTLILYNLSDLLFKDSPDRRRIAFLASCLHILSPAGLFLSTPCSESLFACIHYFAYYLFAKALLWQARSAFWKHDLAIVASGLFVALATSIRSNGLVSGLVFLYEFGFDAFRILNLEVTMVRIRKAMVTVMGGLLVASGSILPQYAAYLDYCTGKGEEPLRPWCSAIPPSIYNFVQSYYWDNGFLRYWTISNLPLFLLAVPCFTLLFTSTWWAWKLNSIHGRLDTLQKPFQKTSLRILGAFALTQGALALMILSRNHVQIITRISSGYPLWYMWLASMIVKGSREDASQVVKHKWAEVAVRWMIVYSIVQGALYASFLPPA